MCLRSLTVVSCDRFAIVCSLIRSIAVEEAKATQKAAEDAVRSATAREAAVVAVGQRAAARVVEARQAVWKLADAERRKRETGGSREEGWEGVAGRSNGAARSRYGEGGGVVEARETHLGSTVSATELCRRVYEIQERRKRVVSLLLLQH